MEYLDIYDEKGNYLGKEERDIVHRDALWHNTVHCWLYDKFGNVYFQIRKDSNTFYTTASGHVSAGETIKEAFAREVKEEIGIDVDIDKSSKVNIFKFVMDKIKKDGSVFRDRAFSNVYVCEYNDDIDKFEFDLEEINGLAKINSRDALKLLSGEEEEVEAYIITQEEKEKKLISKNVSVKDFLINENETGIGKYGEVLEKIIELVLEVERI
ncbi:MAG: NUDIX domain-containing protein [Clostridia bacterium]|jgi:8-oxo-dGTP pyrophosphatase MutT (NUDIX family)|nr:NUDIX domain-containing protein [Clostridia bacterium]